MCVCELNPISINFDDHLLLRARTALKCGDKINRVLNGHEGGMECNF